MAWLVEFVFINLNWYLCKTWLSSRNSIPGNFEGKGSTDIGKKCVWVVNFLI